MKKGNEPYETNDTIREMNVLVGDGGPRDMPRRGPTQGSRAQQLSTSPRLQTPFCSLLDVASALIPVISAFVRFSSDSRTVPRSAPESEARAKDQST